MSVKHEADTRRGPGRPRTRPPAAPRRMTGGKPLSRDQKSALCQLARQAFDKRDAMGLVDVPGSSVTARFENWRRDEQFNAVKIRSLTECNNNHYRTLRAHFNGLMGRDDKSFKDYLRTGKVKDHGAQRDTHENREAVRTVIVRELQQHGYRCSQLRPEYDAKVAAHVFEKGGMITAPYVVTIAKSKFRGRNLDTLTTQELEQILYTVRNRIASKEGRNETIGGRNKKQRDAGWKAKQARARGDNDGTFVERKTQA